MDDLTGIDVRSTAQGRCDVEQSDRFSDPSGSREDDEPIVDPRDRRDVIEDRSAEAQIVVGAVHEQRMTLYPPERVEVMGGGAPPRVCVRERPAEVVVSHDDETSPQKVGGSDHLVPAKGGGSDISVARRRWGVSADVPPENRRDVNEMSTELPSTGVYKGLRES
jgi:hypothetical protein